MPETSRPAAPSAQPTPSPLRWLELRLRAARAALLWERSWPDLALVLGVVGLYAAAALVDLPAVIPGWLHALGLAVLAGLLGFAIWRATRALRVPATEEGRRRIETASGLDHRPLTALTDKLAGGVGDPISAALWAAHRARMAGRVRKLRIGRPLAALLRRDPFGLRVVLTMALLVGVLDAGSDAGDRLLRGLVPDLSFEPGAAAVTTLDIWVTPPDFTGEPPLFLKRDAALTEPIPIPTGSTVLAQVQGGSEPPRLEVGGKSTDFTRIDANNYKGGATLTEGDKLAVTQGAATLGSWPIRIIPNQPPTIRFSSPPQKTVHDALKLDYHASDEYGVESAKAVIRRVGGDDNETIELDLPLPGLHPKEAQDSSFYDLTPHPWAGLPVRIQLEARNAPGLVGKSDEVTFTLPERVFRNAFARALIEQRRELTVHPKDADVVSETLSDLSLQPGFFEDDKVVFLGLRIASLRLKNDDPKTAIPTVQQLLWDLALRLEDGHETIAQRDLRDLMQQLQNALANNAPDEEIERLTKELKDAIDRYLKALAENMQKQNPNGQDQQPIDPSRLMTDRDLQRMLDRARDLARSGAKDAARDLLSQLQNMLENMRTAQPRQMMGQGNQAMRDLQQLMNRQQQLLDRTYRESRQHGRPQPGQNGEATEQEAIRRQLGEIMRELGQQGQDAPQSLGRADRSMGDAAQALGRGEPGDAVGPETDALDALQQATKDIIDQMTSAFGGTGDSGLPDGVLPNADRDPLGRPTGDSADGTYSDGRLRMGESKDDSFGTERAKEILDELRRRAGDTQRPETEREYIDRLLQRF